MVVIPALLQAVVLRATMSKEMMPGGGGLSHPGA